MARGHVGETRQAILDDLRVYGPIDSPTGAATGVLIHSIGWTGSSGGISGQLLALEREHPIGVVRHLGPGGKRCYRIALPEHGDTPMEPGRNGSPGKPAAAAATNGHHPDGPAPTIRGSIDGRCKTCMDKGAPCAMHTYVIPEPDLQPPAPAAVAPPPKAPAPVAQAPKPAVPGSGPPPLSQVELARQLAVIIGSTAEQLIEFAELRGSYAEAVDENARLRRDLLAAHEKIGRLERANELLGQRVTRQAVPA